MQVEPGIITKGAKRESTSEYLDYEGVVRLTYITVPVLLRVKIINGFYVLGGIELNSMVDATAIYDGEKSYIQSLYDNTFELALQGGLSYKFFDRIYLSGKYSHGLTNTMEISELNESGDPIGEIYSRNRGFIFSVGFLLF